MYTGHCALMMSVSICLVVFSLLGEVPHDLKFYWRCVLYRIDRLCSSLIGTASWPPRRLRSWMDLSLMALTFALTIFWDLEMGIAVSLVISLVLVVHKSSKPRMTILVSACLIWAQYITDLTG